MWHSKTVLLAVTMALLASSRAGADDSTPTTTVHLALVGDSTVAESSGWGMGFRELLGEGSLCENHAAGGRSSRSFRAEGRWQPVLAAKPNYVLIQFGHNDQPGKGPHRESAADGDFRDHLRRYVSEARAAGIRPVLVTSLTRRRWNEQGRVVPTLADYAEATAAVANELDVPLLDLRQRSMQQCNACGPAAFEAFEPRTENGVDHTHLNEAGSRFVGRLVAAELVKVVPELAASFVAAKVNALSLRETEAVVVITQGSSPVLVYNKQAPPLPSGLDTVYRRNGFVHPVASPAASVVTGCYPLDHPHQDGIFAAWVKTRHGDRKVDFWNLAGGTGRVVHERVVSVSTEVTGARLEVDLLHRAEAEPAVDVLRERWKVTVRPADGYHCFDIESLQQALTDVPLVVDEYHYGGMALRGPTRWLLPSGGASNSKPDVQREGAVFLNDRGSDRLQGNHERAKWVALSGTSDGQTACIAVLCHAENFRAPQAARLHPTKPYFSFSPCVDGEITIDKQHPLRSRYRYLVTDARPDPDWLDEQWQQWCGDQR